MGCRSCEERRKRIEKWMKLAKEQVARKFSKVKNAKVEDGKVQAEPATGHEPEDKD